MCECVFFSCCTHNQDLSKSCSGCMAIMAWVLGRACSHPSELFKLFESNKIKPTTMVGVLNESLGDLWGGRGDRDEDLGLFLNQPRQNQQCLACCSEREEELAERTALKGAPPALKEHPHSSMRVSLQGWAGSGVWWVLPCTCAHPHTSAELLPSLPARCLPSPGLGCASSATPPCQKRCQPCCSGSEGGMCCLPAWLQGPNLCPHTLQPSGDPTGMSLTGEKKKTPNQQERGEQL